MVLEKSNQETIVQIGKADEAIEERERLSYEYLDKLNINYEIYRHPDASTMDICNIIDKETGIPHFKNLFLCNRQATDFYLMLIDGNTSFRTSIVSKLIGVSRLSFASSEMLSEKLNLVGGGVTPLGLMFNTKHDVTVIVDKSIYHHDRLLMHPCVSTASVAITPAALKCLISSYENRYIEIDIPRENS